MIKTMLGDFTKGEKVAIVMYGPCGQEYVYKGIVHGKRECMGRECQGNKTFIFTGTWNTITTLCKKRSASFFSPADTNEDSLKTGFPSFRTSPGNSSHKQKSGNANHLYSLFALLQTPIMFPYPNFSLKQTNCTHYWRTKISSPQVTLFTHPNPTKSQQPTSKTQKRNATGSANKSQIIRLDSHFLVSFHP